MKLGVFALFAVTIALTGLAAAERHMMQPVVPADKLAEARALKSPLSDSPQIIDRGKAIYDGKGGCRANGNAIIYLSPRASDHRLRRNSWL